jgi:hypothetical protein
MDTGVYHPCSGVPACRLVWNHPLGGGGVCWFIDGPSAPPPQPTSDMHVDDPLPLRASELRLAPPPGRRPHSVNPYPSPVVPIPMTALQFERRRNFPLVVSLSVPTTITTRIKDVVTMRLGQLQSTLSAEANHLEDDGSDVRDVTAVLCSSGGGWECGGKA